MNRPSAHTRYLSFTADRVRLVQFAEDLRELPDALDGLKREVVNELRLRDSEERERLGI